MKRKFWVALLSVAMLTACAFSFAACDSGNAGQGSAEQGETQQGGTDQGGTEQKPGTEGLEYALINGDTEYEVSGIGTAADTEIVIPSIYNGLPVTSINSRAFYRSAKLTSIVIPDSVMSIGDSAFA